ncbi:MAG: DUF456 family protein [Coriobacteriia bacterium]|nr:DUF456 family protein [Coriobacteriia bacterium]
MTTLLWILIIICFVAAFASLVMPVIPGIPLLWAGVLIYHFGIDGAQLGWFFWLALTAGSLAVLLADVIANRYFLTRSDSSTWSERIGPVAIIVGAFIIPPFGLIIVPFAAVLAIELLHKKSLDQAFRIAGATVISFLSSTVAKALILAALVILFIIYIL